MIYQGVWFQEIHSLKYLAMIEPRKIRTVLNIVFEYWNYCVGSMAIITGFWLFFLKQIDKETFAYIIGAVITLKWVWKPKEKEGKND